MFEIIPNWHPVLVHFTVALFSVSVVLFLLTSLMRKSELAHNWRVIARWSLWFGMGMTTLTVASGLYAYNTVAHDTPSHAAMTDHRNWALVTVGLFSLLTIWSLLKHRGGAKASLIFVMAMMIGSGVLASTAWRGGEAVYRYGLGVMSLPQSDDHGHGESSADDDHHAEETMEKSSHARNYERNKTSKVSASDIKEIPMTKVAAPKATKKSDHYDDGHTH